MASRPADALINCVLTPVILVPIASFYCFQEQAVQMSTVKVHEWRMRRDSAQMNGICIGEVDEVGEGCGSLDKKSNRGDCSSPQDY